MASLSAHLRQTGDHGRLGFHANCPVCREERLFGALSSESAISRRAQAALATGALMVSLVAPPAVSAQEADNRHEGNVAPQDPSDGREGDIPRESETPGFDPGGDTVLPVEADPPQGAPQGTADDGAGEGGPLEKEPQVDPDVRLVPPTESETTAPSPNDESPVAPAPVPPAADTPPSDTGASKKPVTVESHPGRRLTTKKRPPRTGPTRTSGKPERQPAERPERPISHAPAPSPPESVQTAEAVEQTSSTVELAAVAQGHRAAPPVQGGSRFHVVRPGESLWSIASGLLGHDASMARIAREVARLWQLNDDRIATGDPDLLKVGTRLRLR